MSDWTFFASRLLAATIGSFIGSFIGIWLAQKIFASRAVRVEIGLERREQND